MPVNAVVGYDGSPTASAAIDAGALLFPQAHAWLTYLWTPPFASERLRRRLRADARNVNELIEMIEREGEEKLKGWWREGLRWPAPPVGMPSPY